MAATATVMVIPSCVHRQAGPRARGRLHLFKFGVRRRTQVHGPVTVVLSLWYSQSAVTQHHQRAHLQTGELHISHPTMHSSQVVAYIYFPAECDFALCKVCEEPDVAAQYTHQDKANPCKRPAKVSNSVSAALCRPSRKKCNHPVASRAPASPACSCWQIETVL